MGGGSDTTTTTQTTELSPEQLEILVQQFETGAGITDAGVEVGDELAAAPREIVGLTDTEYAARDQLAEGIDTAEVVGDEALNFAGGDPSKFDTGYDPGYTTGAISDLEQGGAFESTYTGEALTPEAIDASIDRYESRYTDDVVESTLANMERQAQRDAMERESAAAAVGGTTNSRMAVGQSVADVNTNLAMAQTEAELRDAAYRSAVEAGMSEAEARDAADRASEDFRLQNVDRQMQGIDMGDSALRFSTQTELDEMGLAQEEARLLNDLASASQQRASAGAAGLQAYGEAERALEQQQLDAIRNAPVEGLQVSQSAYSAGIGNQVLPPGGTTTGTTTTPGPSIGEQVLGAGVALGGAALGNPAIVGSDRRMKEDEREAGDNLEKVRRLNPYSYRYRKGFGHTEDRTTGLMADDVRGAGIEGGVVNVGGIDHVDTYAVLATIAGAVRELDGRLAGLES